MTTSISSVCDRYLSDYLIACGGDVNAVDDKGYNVIMRAPLLLRYWIDNGLVMVNDHDYCFSVLSLSANSGHASNVDCVLNMCINMCQFDVNKSNSQGLTLLNMSIYNSHANEILKNHGAAI